MWLKNYLSQDVYNILNLFFNKESLWRSCAQIFFHSVYMKGKWKYDWTKVTRPIILEYVTLEALMKGEVINLILKEGRE